MDGPLFHDTSDSVAAYAAVPPGADQEGPYERPPQAMGGGFDRLPPKTHRLEFATYDGSEYPLNWLNHCEQFFQGRQNVDCVVPPPGPGANLVLRPRAG